MEIKNILVIGAGTMGRGIAQWFAQQNITSTLTDINESLLQESKDQLYLSWEKLQRKGKFDQNSVDKFKSNLQLSNTPKYNEYDLIIEAVVENIKVKQTIFTQIESQLPKDSQTIIATNTSSISIDKLSSTFTKFNKNNFLGIHFFNPAPIMKLVELVKGSQTSDKMIKSFQVFFTQYKKIPVISSDSPGFIVNRVNRNFFGEALVHLNHYDQNNVIEIDNIFKEVAGFRMGPFELMDLIGVDVNFDVTKSVWKQFFYNPRFEPHKIQEALVNLKHFGIKTKKGFYSYE